MHIASITSSWFASATNAVDQPPVVCVCVSSGFDACLWAAEQQWQPAVEATTAEGVTAKYNNPVHQVAQCGDEKREKKTLQQSPTS